MIAESECTQVKSGAADKSDGSIRMHLGGKRCRPFFDLNKIVVRVKKGENPKGEQKTQSPSQALTDLLRKMKLVRENQVEEAEEEEEVKSPSNQTRKETRKGEA